MVNKRLPVITIDGPAGAGKSTVARQLAAKLGLKFLDTGAMYRAFTWAALARNVDLRDPAALVRLIRDSHLDFERGRIMLDGWDITDEIRAERVTKNAVHLADPPAVREELVKLQREFGREGGLVTEGRDQGTVVFPDADFKFY
ncbi:MAG TPA: (d)CMP kinase, partial [Planctomycetota bacterium]|nr:(d)CMP kinase [Planctomycetota bacterium]